MSRFAEWENAQDELEKAWYFFNNAPTALHTDLALQKVKVLEDNLKYLREKSKLERPLRVPVKPAKKPNLLKKLINKIRGV